VEQRFRVYLGDTPATVEQLARIEEIVVEQEMDMVWEARMRFAFAMSAAGAWQEPAEKLASPFTRLRIELKLGKDSYRPLIDGPVAAYESGLDAQPGRSTATVMVRDDSVFLNREEDQEVFRDKTDDAVAREVFGRFSQIGSQSIESAGDAERIAVRRGTAMRFLRELARAHDFHAYVLPGEQRGKSIGCWRGDPKGPVDLPALIVVGSERNVASVTIRQDQEGPQRTKGRTLRISDQEEVSYDSSSQDLELLADLPPISDDLSALRLVPPEQSQREDPSLRAKALTRESGYAFRVAGRVIPGAYPKALTPYQKVDIRIGETPYSGPYLLTRVTHRITPSIYTQEFEAKGNGQPAAGAGGGALAAIAAVF
jgi:phage protein D